MKTTQKAIKKKMVYNSCSNGSAGNSRYILFCEMGAEKFGSLLPV